jgi:hypothetical protein
MKTDKEQETREKLHKAVDEIDLKDLKVLENVSAGAVDINVCGSGCFRPN